MPENVNTDCRRNSVGKRIRRKCTADQTLFCRRHFVIGCVFCLRVDEKLQVYRKIRRVLLAIELMYAVREIRQNSRQNGVIHRNLRVSIDVLCTRRPVGEHSAKCG